MGFKAETLNAARKNLAAARKIMATGNYRAALPMIEAAHADASFVREQDTMDLLIQSHEDRIRKEMRQKLFGGTHAG
jgi:predicted S18 family serine protease